MDLIILLKYIFQDNFYNIRLGYKRLCLRIEFDSFVSATTYNGWNGVSTFSPSLTNDYKEQLTYDPNGNVQTALRNGSSTQLSLENFTYNYDANNKNKLNSIQNNVGNTTYNYTYDAIGEQTKDELEGNTNITWTVYGKIKSVTKTDGTGLITWIRFGN